MARAAISKSVEAVVESWISVMEGHDSAVRNLDPSRLEDEMMVSINGPNLAHSKVMVKEGMTHLWAKSKHREDKQGHFIRRADKIKTWVVSKSVDTLRKAPVKLPFIM